MVFPLFLVQHPCISKKKSNKPLEHTQNSAPRYNNMKGFPNHKQVVKLRVKKMYVPTGFLGVGSETKTAPKKLAETKIPSLKLTASLHPKMGCLEDVRLSFLGRFGLFSGAKLLLVSGKVHPFLGRSINDDDFFHTFTPLFGSWVDLLLAFLAFWDQFLSWS